MMADLLTLDMGASRSKWALFAGLQMRQTGQAPPLSGHLYTPELRQGMADALSNVRATVPARPGCIVAGVTGLQAEYAPVIAELLAATFQLSPAAVYVTDDLHLAHAAHFAGGAGTLVYAGTGSMAYHRTARGAVIRAGGHGFLIDDAGGAFWQGREGLKVVLRQADEGEKESQLSSAIYAATGREWPEIRAYVYGEGRAAVARLAPAVYAAALQGDQAALEIQQRAGEELSRLGKIVLHGSRESELAAAGGAFNPLVLEAFRVRLGPDLALRPGVSPLRGGPALAEHFLNPYLQGNA